MFGQHYYLRNIGRPRRALATLEFVMALPLLFILMLCVMYVGFWGIGQTEVIVEARNKAWQRRFENASKKPLYFPILKGLYNENADYVTEKASKRIQLSPALDRFPQPEASHTILAGSWDHAAMSFKEPPDLKLMAVAAGVGLFGPLLDKVAALDDPLGLVKEIAGAKSFADNERRTADSKKGSVGKDDSGGGSGSGGSGPVPDTGQAAADGEAATKAEQEAEKKKLIDRYQALGGRYQFTGFQRGEIIPEDNELRQAFDARADLQEKQAIKARQALNELNADRRKLLQAEADRLKRQAEVADVKFQRLNAEAHELVKEMRAVGMNEFEIGQL